MDNIVMDRFGNKLSDGDTVIWMVPGTNGLMTTVAKIDHGGILMPVKGKGRGLETTKGKVVMQVVIDLPDPEGKPVKFADMIKSFDPNSSKLADMLMEQ